MKSSRVNEIDGLRFIAVLLVVLFHYTFSGYASNGMSIMPYASLAPVSKYGYLGVYLFFLISGFVILMTASSGSLRKFFVSRIVRLYPTFWLCCTITFLASVAIGGQKYSTSISQYLINLTMLSEFFGVPSIDGAYWSLFVELKFYALVCLVLILRKIHKAEFFLIAWLAIVIVLDPIKIYKIRSILIIDHAPYFIAGAMFFLVWSRGLSWSRILVILVAWFLAIKNGLIESLSLQSHYNVSINNNVVITIISSFFVIMFLIATRKTGSLGKKKWISLGALTYPLYLLHQNIGFMIFNIGYPKINPHILLWSTILLMMGLSLIITLLIERFCSTQLRDFLNNVIKSWSLKLEFISGKSSDLDR